jgi:hypothetical protein
MTHEELPEGYEPTNAVEATVGVERKYETVWVSPMVGADVYRGKSVSFSRKEKVTLALVMWTTILLTAGIVTVICMQALSNM